MPSTPWPGEQNALCASVARSSWGGGMAPFELGDVLARTRVALRIERLGGSASVARPAERHQLAKHVQDALGPREGGAADLLVDVELWQLAPDRGRARSQHQSLPPTRHSQRS